MSDWSMFELEDIIWDEFGETGDHIVPRRSTEQGDCHKKPQHEVANAFGRSPDNKKPGSSFHGKGECPPMLDRGSWSDAPDSEFAALYNIACPDKEAVLASKETKLSDNCFKTGCSQDAVTENNLCHFSLSGFSPSDSDIEVLGNGDEEKESSNLLDYGWPDIGNFEDVDRMFRVCDSTFGQGDICTAEELAWTSSFSQLVADHEVIKSSFRHLSSENGASKSKSNQYDPNMEFIPRDNPPVLTEQEKETESSPFPAGPWISDRNEPSRYNYCTLANQFDSGSENKGESAWKEQPLERSARKEVKTSSQSQTHSEGSLMGCRETSMVNAQRQQLKSQNQYGGNKGQPPKYLSGVSLLGTSPMKQFSNQNLPVSTATSLPVFPSAIAQTKKFWGPDSFRYMHTHIPCIPVGYSYSSHQLPVAPAMSRIKSENHSQPARSRRASAHFLNCGESLERSQEPPSKAPSMTPQEKIEKLRKRQKIRAAFTIEQQCFHGHNHQVQNHPRDIQDEVAVDNDIEGKGVLTVAEADSSTAQESSCMGFMSYDELSPEESCFRQLQDVVAKLDVRTKLCIRDSLYRLARSAEQRHTFSGISSSCADGRERNAVLVTKSYSHDRLQHSSCAGSTDVETNTNPIDRSIAHLLFHRPSDSFSVPASDVLSLESKIMNQCCISSEPVIPDQQVCAKDVSGDIDTHINIMSK